MDMTVTIVADPQEGIGSAVDASIVDAHTPHDTVIEPVKRRRLQTMGHVHNSIITDVVASELLKVGVDLRAQTVVSSTSTNHNDLPAPKKMTPRRKQVPKFVAQATRSSPRLSAEKRPAGAVSTSAICSSDPDIGVVGELDVARKVVTATYKRKKGLKDAAKPTRTSPRLLAKQKPAGAAKSSVIDVDVCSPHRDPDVVEEADAAYKGNSEGDAISDNIYTAAPSVSNPVANIVSESAATDSLDTNSADVLPVSNIASTTAIVLSDMPFLAPDHGVSPPISTVHVDAIHVSSVVAGSSVGVEGFAVSNDSDPHAPLHAVKAVGASGSITCTLSVAAPIFSDAVRTSASKTGDTILHDVHVPEAQGTHTGVTPPSNVYGPCGLSTMINVPAAVTTPAVNLKVIQEVSDTWQKKVDEVAAKNDGFFPASMLFGPFIEPGCKSGSHIDSPGNPPHHAPEAEASEHVGFAAASVPGSSGTGHIPEAGASLPTDAPSLACSSIIRIVEPTDLLPLSFAMPTSSAQTETVARDKVKSCAKDGSGVISLDDLLDEKMAVQKSCSSSKTVPVGKYIGSEDVQVYCTPAMAAPPCIIDVPSITPKSRIRVERVVQPSQYLLPPYVTIRSTAHQDALYRKLIIHTRSSKVSRLKDTIILEIGPMWVSASELADSMKPNGELSNTVVEIGVHVLQQSCADSNKVIFPWIVSCYLLDHNFQSNVLKKHFRKDDKYKLSHKILLCFPVLQKLGTSAKARSHWYMLSLNLAAKRFEILDSVSGPDDDGMIDHATRLMDAIKRMFLVNYKDSRKQIQDYELVYIPAPKQDNEFDCGFFTLKFLELWDGRVSPAISFDQIPELRKVLAVRWLEHRENKLTEWRNLLDKYVF